LLVATVLCVVALSVLKSSVIGALLVFIRSIFIYEGIAEW
jgi:hypothetical protein